MRYNNYKKKKYNITFIKRFLNNHNPIPVPQGDTECAICLEEANVDININTDIESGQTEALNDVWLELECKHKYHKSCITEWLKYSTLCPYCKRSVMPNNDINLYNYV